MNAYLPHHARTLRGRAPGSGAPARAVRTAGRGLIWSEYLFLAGTAAAIAVVVDPAEWDLASDTLIKHLGMLVAVGATLMTLAGRAILRRPGTAQALADPLRAGWPLALLALFVLGGSAYARLVLGVQDSFLNVGLYMLLTFCAASMVLQSEDPDALARGHLRILLAGALVMCLALIRNYGTRQVYHEQIFLVIPMAAYFCARRPRTFGGLLCAALFISMAGFSRKYTSYMIGALSVFYLVATLLLPVALRRPGPQRAAALYWGTAGLLLAASMAALSVSEGGAGSPTGNTEYRMHTYEAAWERFLDSPWWGAGFADAAVQKFSLYSIGIAGNLLPTHSDVLDLLANGGALAFVLWVAGLVAILLPAFRRLLGAGRLGHPGSPAAHALALMSIAAIVDYGFNPILLQPSMAALVWINLGLLFGLSLRARQEGTP